MLPSRTRVLRTYELDDTSQDHDHDDSFWERLLLTIHIGILSKYSIDLTLTEWLLTGMLPIIQKSSRASHDLKTNFT
jgi:hypothetical protein